MSNENMRNEYIAKCTKDINIDFLNYRKMEARIEVKRVGLPQFIFTLNVVTYIKAFTAAVA